MTDSIQVDGKELISSKRASESSGYAQDYIGQLARGGLIVAQRVGGLWYVSLDSLNGYKDDAEKTKRETQIPQQEQKSLDTLISFDGREFVSAPYAAKLTGYHQDYVGQLARSGKVLSRNIGNRWYVDKKALIEHKKEKDALLAAVQSESVGIRPRKQEFSANNTQHTPVDEPFYTYLNDEPSKSLLPLADKGGYRGGRYEEEVPVHQPEQQHYGNRDVETQTIPIRIKRDVPESRSVAQNKQKSAYKSKHNKLVIPTLALAGILTIILLVAVGAPTGKLGGIFARGVQIPSSNTASAASGLGASAQNAIEKIGDFLENIIVPEISYKRSN